MLVHEYNCWVLYYISELSGVVSCEPLVHQYLASLASSCIY